MLRKAKDCLGFSVEAIDGFIGTLSDIYFDDSEWAVRYFVVEVSSGSDTIKALISPLSVGKADWEKRALPVSLTKKRITASPQAQVDLPISRQYEIALRRYYEWPVYWGQSEFLDTPSVKKMPSPPRIPSDEDAAEMRESEPQLGDDERYEEEDEEEGDGPMLSVGREPDDSEIAELEFAAAEQDGTYSAALRSFNEILGYHIESAQGEEAGVLDDLILDDEEWVCRYLAINLGVGSVYKRALLTLHWAGDIDWGMSRIHITLSQSALRDSPPCDNTLAVSREYEKKLFDYYDKLKLI
ncbi:MAG: hypothetical protein LBB56_04255 [Chitinispirillales bacterium]|nr:hypothetical protein [Chitinispirillales bacterium]